MLPSREHDLYAPDALPPGYVEILLRVLAISGYGLWVWLGMGVALGMNQIGDGPMQMPLMLGTALVGAGLGSRGQRVAGGSDGYGTSPSGRRWPTRAGWMALTCLGPVLLLILLGDGHGHALVMRLAGALLMLCSLVSLVQSACRFRNQLSPDLQRLSSSLPVSRLVTAWYGGGLWLWLCFMLQSGPEPEHGAYPWVLLLLALALLLGLLEGMRWQSLEPAHAGDHDSILHPVSPLRMFAALLVYVLPCAALLLTERFGGGLLAAAVAVPSCLLGKMVEQHVYQTALCDELPLAG
ncbi:hypothetical protein PY254_01970 [Rhodanobacter sp. AS-Z3]|uniref:hypothetical protein n=1 Tax=Rhodanobacter sp. AS-Z3 TaxID=3031330 RepID=UPI00247AE5B5|nr:hypothetical protein [Rhodanobacter sp. AS-Z3]WEN15468.1 hypothetical protein PY254_01970 [Rhodanobacter sp. AS-Z3]